jgi:hypothetical protein
MTAFRRFDPYAILSKADRERRTLAALAGLAGVTAEIEDDADASVISDSNRADENRNLKDTPAKVAKPAKVDADEAGTLATLARSSPEAENPGRWGEAEEERASIVEHDGKIPRAWAEGFTRLDPDHPPRDVPAKRWLAFIDDIGRFLDSPFCAVAAALGWGPLDLFGADRNRPFARIDRTGLLWLLNGDRVIALTENTATIETRTGARQTFRRKPSEPDRVLPWELEDGQRRRVADQ